jgi:hypothetical protein
MISLRNYIDNKLRHYTYKKNETFFESNPIGEDMLSEEDVRGLMDYIKNNQSESGIWFQLDDLNRDSSLYLKVQRLVETISAKINQCICRLPNVDERVTYFIFTSSEAKSNMPQKNLKSNGKRFGYFISLSAESVILEYESIDCDKIMNTIKINQKGLITVSKDFTFTSAIQVQDTLCLFVCYEVNNNPKTINLENYRNDQKVSITTLRLYSLFVFEIIVSD